MEPCVDRGRREPSIGQLTTGQDPVLLARDRPDLQVNVTLIAASRVAVTLACPRQVNVTSILSAGSRVTLTCHGA
jgi:hypothetical protein